MESFEIVRDRVAFTASEDGPAGSFKSVLGKYKNVQKIIYDARFPYLLVERTPSKEDQEAGLIPTYEQIYQLIRSSIPIEEYAEEKGAKSSADYLFGMFREVGREDLFPSLLLVSSRKEFNNWANLSRRDTFVCGVPIHEISDLPSGTMLLCGTGSRDSEGEGIQMAMKGYYV